MSDTIPQRKLRVTIQGPNQSVTLSGYRMSAVIQHAGGVSNGQLFLSIWGLDRSLMDGLSTYGMKVNLISKFPITLEAGDDQNGMAKVFLGNIITGEANYSGQPEVDLRIVANNIGPEAVAPVPATSFRGSVDVATVMLGFATQMGLFFENSGVQTRLRNPSFTGSAYDQMQSCAEQANINAVVVDDTLAIWPKFGSRNGSIPLVSPQTGMLEYPSFNALGVSVRSLFNRSIGFGQEVKIQSSITAACGQFTVCNLMHELDAELPDGGKWFTTIDTYGPAIFPPSVL